MHHTTRQLSLEAMNVTSLLAESPDAPRSANGVVFTRRWVVELILDLAGYTAERDLCAVRAVEPACGAGAFLIPMIERLASSCRTHGHDLRETGDAIRAYDLLPHNVDASRQAAVRVLRAHGLPLATAAGLAKRWITPADFLLRDEGDRPADFVVGNPPYIRLENVPLARRAAYRNACVTMRGRSDVFVGFIERGLRLLRDGGVLGFIVPDRWMRNQYGAELRAMIGAAFSVETLIHMHNVDAFENRVSAYPAITVIRRGRQGQPVVANAMATFGQGDAARLADWVNSDRGASMRGRGVEAARLADWFTGSLSWPAGSPEELALLADLETRFPPLEDRRTGTRVGIGVATGADSVYLTDDPHLVEEDRLLPLVRAGDTTSGTVSWSGTYLVNPWQDGRLVNLDDYPRLRRYLSEHEQDVRARHVAQRNPKSWYRTIDRIEPELLGRTKLLVPDLKASIHPVLENGRYYPHHNLYHVTTDVWEPDVLGGLLLSDIANLFVGAYCVKMRGGCYRFQAQYLRRIRVPHPESLRAGDRRALADAFAGRDVEAATDIACRLYRIDKFPASRRGRLIETA